MTEWRRAGADDAVALRDLERAANLVGLAEVFPAADFPFPGEEVLARWEAVLADPTAAVDVIDSGSGLIAFAAYDAVVLRHLGVHPSAWGSGLGRAGVERSGATRLWVLADNHRARGLYDRLGWRTTGLTRDCPWPPYPVEIEMGRSS